MTTICPYRQEPCLLMCGETLPLNDMDEHIKEYCSKAIVICKNKCGLKINRGEQEQHLFGCRLEPVNCPNRGESLFEDGCSFVVKRKDLDVHIKNCPFRKALCSHTKC